MPRTARLTRDDWAAAALDALAEGGPATVAVEPVAARLGASKSSFYWLFENREALLVAALERWERVQTDEVLPTLAAVADPAERLRLLIRHAFTSTRGGALALVLLTESDDPTVRAVAERVTHRRLITIEAALTELGHTPERARHLAAASYAVYLGTAALRMVDAAPRDAGPYVDTVMALLSNSTPH
ncbi:TetR/AcrR family transcriptional regulator [Streptomyces sp. SID3343]|uniref:TetR family transcriptional regulator n=1 Tax=Streptomyces sp. SID3343 TaxID=2690260 RepID=UPI00136C74D0|nr:TetR family transcriptional regulator [Streptomyces sp. SID3343]